MVRDLEKDEERILCGYSSEVRCLGTVYQIVKCRTIWVAQHQYGLHNDSKHLETYVFELTEELDTPDRGFSSGEL